MHVLLQNTNSPYQDIYLLVFIIVYYYLIFVSNTADLMTLHELHETKHEINYMKLNI